MVVRIYADGLVMGEPPGLYGLEATRRSEFYESASRSYAGISRGADSEES